MAFAQPCSSRSYDEMADDVALYLSSHDAGVPTTLIGAKSACAGASTLTHHTPRTLDGGQGGNAAGAAQSPFGAEVGGGGHQVRD